MPSFHFRSQYIVYVHRKPSVWTNFLWKCVFIYSGQMRIGPDRVHVPYIPQHRSNTSKGRILFIEFSQSFESWTTWDHYGVWVDYPLGTGHLKAMTRDMTLDSWVDNSSPRLEQIYRSDGCPSDHDGVEGVPAIRRMDLTFRLAISWMFLGMLFRGLIPHTHCYSCSMHQYSVRKIHAAQRLPG